MAGEPLRRGTGAGDGPSPIVSAGSSIVRSPRSAHGATQSPRGAGAGAGAVPHDAASTGALAAGSTRTRSKGSAAAPVLHRYLEDRALEETQHSALLRVTRTRDHESLSFLLDELEPRKVVEDVDYRGMSAMHHAAALGDLPALRLLLERTDAKELLERRDRCGSTPLHHAALLKHPDAVRMLLKAGANINAQKANGRTALHEAAWIGHLEVLEPLIQAGADPEILEANHRTAAQLARLNHADAAAERVEAYIKKIADDTYQADLARRQNEWMSSFRKAKNLRRDCGKSRKRRTELTPEERAAKEERRRKREAAKQKRRAAEESITARAAWLEEQRLLAAGIAAGGTSRASSVCSYAVSDSDLSEAGLKRGTFTCHCPYCSTWRKAQEQDEWEAHKQAQLG